MSRTRRVRPNHLLTTAVFLFCAGASLSGHRLDEYLQATQITVDAEAITLDVYLRPGAAIVPAVLVQLDADNTNGVSAAEALAYGTTVVRALRLSIDDRTVGLVLVRCDTSSVAELRDGAGVIHVVAQAADLTMRAGRHSLRVENGFEPLTSVYLANAMLPGDARVRIRDQTRDSNQARIDIAFDIAEPTRPSPGPTALASAVVVVAGAAWWWRRRRALRAGTLDTTDLTT